MINFNLENNSELVVYSKQENFALSWFIKFTFYAFIVIYPFVGGYLPLYTVGKTDLDLKNIYLIVLLGFLGLYIIYRRFDIRFPTYLIWLIIYYLYVLADSYFILGKFAPSTFLNFISVIGVLLLFENLEYTPLDIKLFKWALIVVGSGIFVVSMLQTFVDPYFFMGIHKGTKSGIEMYKDYEGFVRNNSLFTGISPHEGGIAMGLMAMIFLFFNYYDTKKIYMIFFFMMAIAAFLTYSRWVWGIVLIAIIFYGYFKYRHMSFLIIPSLLLAGLVIYLFFFESIEQSQLYQNRVVTDTYMGRVETTDIFLERFFYVRPFFGYGESSWLNSEYMKYNWFGIHVAYFDIMFREGTVGLLLFLTFWTMFFKRTFAIFRQTHFPIFMAFVGAYIFINWTALFDNLYYYGYILIFYFMSMFYKLTVQEKYDPEELLNE